MLIVGIFLFGVICGMAIGHAHIAQIKRNYDDAARHKDETIALLKRRRGDSAYHDVREFYQ